MGNAERTQPLTMIGPKGLERVVGALRTIAPELPFEIKFIELTENVQTIQLEGYEIEAFRVNHAVVCYGYSMKIKRGGKFDAERAKSLEIPIKMWNRLQKGETIEEDGRRFTPDMVLGAERKGIKLTYCTDSRPVESIVNAAKEADLFICEGMYGEPDKDTKAREYKHMTFEEAARLALQANVKELWLTHYSPSLVRPDEYIESARKIFKNTKTARDGFGRTLRFED